MDELSVVADPRNLKLKNLYAFMRVGRRQGVEMVLKCCKKRRFFGCEWHFWGQELGSIISLLAGFKRCLI
jgi:hypothetical protein